MFTWPYIIEVLPPTRVPGYEEHRLFDHFIDQYRYVSEAGCGVSIPDNPMGTPSYSCIDMFEYAGLRPDPEKVLLNLNTYHSKEELDQILEKAAGFGLRYLLVVRGDGGPQLPRLDPLSLGGTYNVATTMDLLRHINSEYGDQFITGATFNPYKKMPFELERAEQKVEAGASFFITQPLIGRDPHVDNLSDLCDKVIVESWMSTDVDIFYKRAGRVVLGGSAAYDPMGNLEELHREYQDTPIFLGKLDLMSKWRETLPALRY